MNLIVQAADIATSHLKQLAKLTGATKIEQITPQAFRLPNATKNGDVTNYCLSVKLDFAFVPEDLKLKHFGLVVMDMDSTLITIECIDEIADMQGLKTKVATITAAAMRGEIDFAESLRQRVSLLEGLEESALQKVYDERLKITPGGETMLVKMRGVGIKSLLVSGGFKFFTERLKQRLTLDYTVANTLEVVDGKLTGRILGDIVDAQAKADALVSVRNQLGLQQKQVIGIGDGANDLKMLHQAGISIAFHAKPIVQQQTNYVLNYTGLDGVLNLFS